MKKIFLFIGIIAIIGIIFLVRNQRPLITSIPNLPAPGETVNLATANPYIQTKEPKEVAFKFEEYTRGLNTPWAMVFTDQTRVVVTERSGKLRSIENKVLTPEPLLTFDEVTAQSEDGLMGLAIDPDYTSNKYLYVCLGYKADDQLYLKIERLKDNGKSVSRDKVLIEKIPAAPLHVGCRMRFGPDKKLYATVGDAGKKEQAQNKDIFAGKILRINNDGTFPTDNPFPGSPVYSLGHRNPQGLDWYPQSNVLYSTEHGPSGNDGPPGGDEVNVIEAGANYGWPVVSHEKTKDGMVSPKILFTPAFAPASGMFYSGRVFPQFYGNFFFGGLRGEGIMRVVVEQSNPSKVLSYGLLPGVEFGRIRDVQQGPDGYIYFTTSNRDGRGSPRDGDDKIYRIVRK